MDGSPQPPPNPYAAPAPAPNLERARLPVNDDEPASRWRRLGGALVDGILV
jgi:hypothetical protein